MAKPDLTFGELENRSEFVNRHIGPTEDEVGQMLSALSLKSLDELVRQTVPASILEGKGLDLAEGLPETEALAKARSYANQNQVFKTFIGMGYSTRSLRQLSCATSPKIPVGTRPTRLTKRRSRKVASKRC